MPAVTKIRKMPDEDRSWLDAELYRRGFGDHQVLSDLLAERGYEISRATLGYYAQQRKKREEKISERVDAALKMVNRLGDNTHTLGVALTLLSQQKIIDILYEHDFEIPDVAENPDGLNELLIQLLKIVPCLNDSALNQERWRKDLAKQLDALAKQAEEDMKKGVVSTDGKPTLDPETIREIQRLYGR